LFYKRKQMYKLRMPSDAFVTFRIPSDLKRRVVEIGGETQRSMSQAFILLLMRGIEAYEDDGFLVDTKAKPKPSESSDPPAIPSKKKKSPGGRRS
jgi:hypothetical protein